MAWRCDGWQLAATARINRSCAQRHPRHAPVTAGSRYTRSPRAPERRSHMLYLITQMLACLLFTAALALIAGWLLRGIGARTQLEALAREREELRTRVSALEERLASAAAPAVSAPAPTVVH